MHSQAVRDDCWLRGGWERGRDSSLPPLLTRGFGYMQPNGPQPCWQCSYLHAQCLVLCPFPPSRRDLAQRWPWRFAGGGARRTGTLLSASTLPGSSHRLPRSWGSAVGSPPCPRCGRPSMRPQSKSQAGCLWQANVVLNSSHPPHRKSLQAWAHLRNPRDCPRRNCWGSAPANACTCRRAERRATCLGRSGAARGSHLPSPAGWPSDLPDKQCC